MAAHWSTFLSDVGKTFGVWRRFPVLPVISLGLYLLPVLLRGWIALAALPIAVLAIGWYGTERMFYLRGFRDKGLEAREAFRFTRAFVGRYFWLGIISMVPLVPVYIAVAAIWDVPFGAQGGTEWAAVAANMIALIVWDVALTFVTPALAYSTPEVGEALSRGIKMLREGWPGTAWYALVPPLAFVTLTYIRPAEPGWDPVLWGMGALATMINLLAKGAVAAFYLREHEVGDDGAAFMGPKRSDSPAPPAMGTT